MPQWDTFSLQTLLLEFLFLKIIRSWKNRMCSTVHVVYVIQKALQRHKLVILVAKWKVLLVSGKTEWIQLLLKPENVKIQSLTFAKWFSLFCFQHLEIKAGFDLTSHVVSRDLKWYCLMTTVNPAAAPWQGTADGQRRMCPCLTTQHKRAAWLSASPPAAATQLCLTPRWTGARLHLLLKASIPLHWVGKGSSVHTLP